MLFSNAWQRLVSLIATFVALYLIRHVDTDSNVVCPELPAIKHGSLQFQKGQQAPFYPGDVIEYSCYDGYGVKNEAPEIRCKLVGGKALWITPEVPCRLKTCDDPGEVNHATRIGDDFRFSQNITFICDKGYKLEGEANIHCNDVGIWVPQIPSCKVVMCPILDHHPKDGRIKSPWKNYGDRAEYECSQGFKLVGDRFRTCQVDGTWSGKEPECAAISCPDLGHPKNGRVIYSRWKYGATAEYKCFQEFKLNGDPIRTCQANGTWSGKEPQCVVTEVCTYPGVLINGEIKPKRAVYKVGDRILFICHDGTRYTARCVENATWDMAPPNCQNICPNPPEVEHADVQFTGYTINSMLTYTCREGYSLNGEKTFKCLTGGIWNITDYPHCKEMKKSNLTVIIGVVVGIVLILIILGLLGFFLSRRRQKKNRRKGFGRSSPDAAELESTKWLTYR